MTEKKRYYYYVVDNEHRIQTRHENILSAYKTLKSDLEFHPEYALKAEKIDLSDVESVISNLVRDTIENELLPNTLSPEEIETLTTNIIETLRAEGFIRQIERNTQSS